MQFDAVRAIEACYAGAADERTWLQSVLDSLEPLTRGLPAVAHTFRIAAGRLHDFAVAPEFYAHQAAGVKRFWQSASPEIIHESARSWPPSTASVRPPRLASRGVRRHHYLPRRCRAGRLRRLHPGPAPVREAPSEPRRPHAARHARLRTKLWMPTLTAVRKNAWLHAYYEGLRARGKLPKVALVASVRKLLVAVHYLAKHRRPIVPILAEARA